MTEVHGQWLQRERQARGWNIPQMAGHLRDAATTAGDAAPTKDSLVVMIRRWEDNRSGVTERYRLHYCAAFQIPVSQFGLSGAASPAVPPGDDPAGRHAGPIPPACGQSIGAQLLAAARESSEHARRAERRRTGPATLEQFRAAVTRLARDLLTGEPVPLFDQVRATRDQLQAAVGARSWPADQHELYSLLGSLNSLMATAAGHIGMPAAAEELALAGLGYATVIADQLLIARLRLDLAITAYWSGQLRDCLDQARTGLQYATGGPVAAQLHLIGARAAARLGDTGTARQAISTACRARDHADSGDPTRIAGLISFSPAAHHHYTGAALAEIPGAGPDAVTELERAIDLYTAAAEPGDAHDHGHMTARATLAAVRLRNGDLHAAGAAASPVLHLPCSRRVSSLRHSFARARSELAAPRYHGSAQASEFDAQIEMFCADTIATHLHDTLS